MSPLPPENTARWYLDYEVGNISHTLVMRTAPGLDPAAVSAMFESLFEALGPQLWSTTITGMRASAEGSNLTFPVPYTGDTTWGSSDATEAQSGGYVSFVGRSTDGRRARVTVFGNKTVQVGGDWRATGTEVGSFVDALAVLNSDGDYFHSISDLPVVWNSYANTGYNAYWRNKTR